MQTTSTPPGTLSQRSTPQKAQDDKLVIKNSPANREILSFHLIRRRHELDIKQEAVAEELGVRQTAVSAWENQLSFPSDKNQQKVFAWLGWDENTVIAKFGLLKERVRDLGIDELSTHTEKLNNPDLLLFFQRIGDLLYRRFEKGIEHQDFRSGKELGQNVTIGIGDTIFPAKGAEAHMNHIGKEGGYDYPLNFRQRQKLQKLLVASSTLLGWTARSFADNTNVPVQLIEEAIDLEIPSDIEYSHSVIAAMSSHCCKLRHWDNKLPVLNPQERYGDDIEGFLKAIRNSDSLVC